MGFKGGGSWCRQRKTATQGVAKDRTRQRNERKNKEQKNLLPLPAHPPELLQGTSRTTSRDGCHGLLTSIGYWVSSRPVRCLKACLEATLLGEGTDRGPETPEVCKQPRHFSPGRSWGAASQDEGPAPAPSLPGGLSLVWEESRAIWVPGSMGSL